MIHDIIIFFLCVVMATLSWYIDVSVLLIVFDLRRRLPFLTIYIY